jgi:IclR family acetate operon transcriptional repressor
MPRAALATLRKGIDILFLFSEAHAALSLPEIAARLKMPTSTTYRFVTALRDLRLLRQEPDTRRFVLGARLLDLRPAIAGPVDLRAAALPSLRELVEQSGETAHVTERRGMGAVIVEVLEAPHVLRMVPKRGTTFPLHAGALSRAILAFLPPKEIEDILSMRPLQRFTPRTPTRRDAVKRLLRETRKNGYAVSFEEVTPGASGISAPILGRDGWAIGSIGISCVLQRLAPADYQTLCEPVQQAGKEVSKLLRHQRKE